MASLSDAALSAWLLANGSPAIRYRTATELLDLPKVDIKILEAELLAAPAVRAWLARLANARVQDLHGSNPDRFENTASKLADLGLRAGMPSLDAPLAPYIAWFREQAATYSLLVEQSRQADSRQQAQAALADAVHWFYSILVGSRLAWLGWHDASLSRRLAARLDTIYAFTVTGNHAIYIDQDTFRDYPAAFRKRRFVDPRCNGILPFIHDIYALAHYPLAILDSTTQGKINTVIDYVLHPDYQALEEGYGVMRAGPRRYYSIGWSIHLPGYNGFELDDGQAGMLLQRLELMAHFPTAVRHPYFEACLAHLESFRTDEGYYCFPARYLRESASGYWVHGAYMRLAENRRVPLALELDSTFRMLRIRRLAGAVG